MCRSTGAIAVCVLALFVPARSFGTAVAGSQLNISGSTNIGTIFFNWNCNQPGDTTCASPPPGVGDFTVSSSDGSFAQYNGTFGLFNQSVNNTIQPPNVPLSILNFITFDLNTTNTIKLTLIPAGTDSPSATCAGLTSCTPTISALTSSSDPLGLTALNLDQSANGTTATLGFDGFVIEPNGDAPFIGIVTTQFAGLNPQEVVTELKNASSAGIPLTFSAQLIVTPEPAPLALTGAGLLVLGLLRRGRQ
jgi:hypothetical protein